jgi:transposase
MMLTANQVAEKLGLSAHTIRQMCEDGRLPGVNTASKDSSRNSWKIDDKALREWRGAQRSNGHAQYEAPVPKAQTVPDGYVTYAEAAVAAGLTESGVSYRVRHGSLPHVKVGGRNYVPAAALQPKQSGKKQTVAPVVKPRVDVTDLRTPTSGITNMLQQIVERLDDLDKKVDALHRVWIG